MKYFLFFVHGYLLVLVGVITYFILQCILANADAFTTTIIQGSFDTVRMIHNQNSKLGNVKVTVTNFQMGSGVIKTTESSSVEMDDQVHFLNCVSFFVINVF